MIASWKGDPDSGFDEDFAQGFIGRTLLVGITHVSALNEVTHQEQVHGVIVAATAAGIDVELHGVNEGRVWRMAPFLDELSPAQPGIYQLRSTGETVENPDFLFSLTTRNSGKH